MRPADREQDSAIAMSAPPTLDARAHALFLDLDGTLAPIVERPSDAAVAEHLRRTLAQLCTAMQGAVALLTGRTVEDADRILGGAVAYIAGVHGAEIRRPGEATRRGDDAQMEAARRDARALVDALPARVDLEDKGVSLALHYRRAPQAEAEVRRIAERVAQRHRLRALPGKMVIEIVAGSRTKASALENFMAQPPFADRLPVAVGDDFTDEDAFAAAQAQGGFAVLVGEPRTSAARFRLADPEAVDRWLAAALERAA